MRTIAIYKGLDPAFTRERSYILYLEITGGALVVWHLERQKLTSGVKYDSLRGFNNDWKIVT